MPGRDLREDLYFLKNTQEAWFNLKYVKGMVPFLYFLRWEMIYIEKKVA